MTWLGIPRQRGPLTLYMHPATYNAVPMACFVSLRSASVIVEDEYVALTIADAFELECFAAAIEPPPTSAPVSPA